MRKILIVSILILFVASTLSSCTGVNTTTKKISNPEKYINTHVTSENEPQLDF